MKKKHKQNKKVYRSIVDVQKKFFPRAYEEQIAEQKNKDPHIFGTGLAKDLLESIRQQLVK